MDIKEKKEKAGKIIPEIVFNNSSHHQVKIAVNDVEFCETKTYNVVAVKYEEHNWTGGSGGIEWIEWIDVWFKKKIIYYDYDKTVHVVTDEKVITRDKYDQKLDRKDLWGYSKIHMCVQKWKEDVINIAWKKEDSSDVVLSKDMYLSVIASHHSFRVSNKS